jgi:hypothetical protein
LILPRVELDVIGLRSITTIGEGQPSPEIASVKFDANVPGKQQAETVEAAACLFFILDLGVANPEIPLLLCFQRPTVVQQGLPQMLCRLE